MENCLYTSVVTHKLLKWFFSTTVSVNQLSIYAAVADMCEDLASRISDCPASTEEPVAEDKPETMVAPADLSTTTKTDQ